MSRRKEYAVFNEQSFESEARGANHDARQAEAPPWRRPAEPDHPMLVDGGVTQGNTELMFRCMVEEYLFAGHALQTILEMCRQPNYQGFHAAMHALGVERAEAIATDAARRVGRHRVRATESMESATAATLTINATTSDSRSRKGA